MADDDEVQGPVKLRKQTRYEETKTETTWIKRKKERWSVRW
jgi:hypothetical protein